MNSKFSNQDLIKATFEIYNEFSKKKLNESNEKIDQKKINKSLSPLLLTKEVELNKNKFSNNFINYKSPINTKITNKEKLREYNKKKKKLKNFSTLILNKILKFENQNYLLLHKIKNSDLKIIKMKKPNI